MTYNNNRQQVQYVSTGDPETAIDDPTKQSFVAGQLGNYVIVQQPSDVNATGGEGQVEAKRNKTYRYVCTDSSMTVAPFPGAVAWWKDKSRFLVTTSPTATARALRAGVFGSGASQIGTNKRGVFIQTGGPATVKFVDGPAGGNPYTTAGLFAIPSATAGKADTAAAGAPSYPQLGITVGSGNAATAEAVVDLDIPDTP
jgi:hypothetical protein